MDIKLLQSVLKKAVGVLNAAGAKKHAAAASSVDTLLGEARATTVEQFVADAAAALNEADVVGIPAAEVVSRICAAGNDSSRFSNILKGLEDRRVDKASVLEIASHYTGARSAKWPSKAAAIKAMRAKFAERVFLDAKAKHNEKVTPY